MVPTKVIVVGAGIAGPLLAVFLKRKGYDPVLCERTEVVSTAGLSLCLQLNGVEVLSKLPGLMERLRGGRVDMFGHYSVLPEDPGVLAENDVPSRIREKFGVGLTGIKRMALLQALVDHAQAEGVPIKWRHKLVSLEQTEDSVKVKFANGSEDTASFVIGCDGLHSNTRICLFGEHSADFTGLVQCGGFSPIPAQMNSVMMDVYGNGAHMIAYPVSDSEVSWAITLRESEAKETWKPMDEPAIEEFRNKSIFRDADFGTKELIRDVTHVIKYGLYDRPELKSWHKGRVLLIGDAAHPTSPHLGQGANQAFEDVDMLIQLLDKYNPSGTAPSTTTLETIYSELEAVRIPRSSLLVKGAHIQGENRVVEGVEECKARNATVRGLWKDPDAVLASMIDMKGALLLRA